MQIIISGKHEHGDGFRYLISKDGYKDISTKYSPSKYRINEIMRVLDFVNNLYSFKVIDFDKKEDLQKIKLSLKKFFEEMGYIKFIFKIVD